MFNITTYQQEKEVRSLITNIITNIPNKTCPSTSDHDVLYIIAKILTDTYQPRYNFIRDTQNLDLQKYIDNFKQLPFTIVYSFYNPDDQLDTFSKIILECIKKCIIHSPTPWMTDLDIVALQNKRNKLKYEALSKRARSAWVAYRKVRNEIKQKINTIKTSFYKNIWNSKNTKYIWKVTHRILSPKSTTVQGNVNDMNKCFNSTAACLTCKQYDKELLGNTQLFTQN